MYDPLTPETLFLDHPSPLGSTLSDKFLRLRIVNEAPSRVSQNYKSLQIDGEQRILDDRPTEDGLVPPISLLYDGFGIFDDVFNGRASVPGESDILETHLWHMVENFVREMSTFYGSEAARRGALLGHLEGIFGARRDPLAVGGILTSKIGPYQIITDGHLNGAHGAIVFCVECKDELSGITSEPFVELVSHVASSFKEGLQKHQTLFEGWRVPALGMIQIGGWTRHALRLHFLTQL